MGKVISLGANEVIDFEKNDFTTLNKKYDYIFDMVGKSSFWKCRKVMESKGVYISTELGKYNANIFYS